MRIRLARGAFPPLALALIALAWIALLVWNASPYRRYLDHDHWTTAGLLGALCSASPSGAALFPVVFYTIGWVVMSAAMMLPTSLPLIRSFDRMVAGQPNRTALQALLIGGYVAAWTAFGIGAHALDAVLHAWLAGSVWLIARPWAPGAVVLALAGGFQFSRLKYLCLDACRSPIAFIMTYWHGVRPLRESLTLGFAHGVYCVGCCWAVMLLMFVVGAANLSWMLILALAMAVEKNHPWGRLLARPLGAALLAAAGALLALQPIAA
jgi:predicted metal-binding membrane protein